MAKNQDEGLKTFFYVPRTADVKGENKGPQERPKRLLIFLLAALVTGGTGLIVPNPVQKALMEKVSRPSQPSLVR